MTSKVVWVKGAQSAGKIIATSVIQIVPANSAEVYNQTPLPVGGLIYRGSGYETKVYLCCQICVKNFIEKL